MAGGAAHDAAQHVAAPFIAGEGTVADQEGYGAGMIRNDPHGNIVPVIGSVLFAGEPLHMADDPLQQIRVIIGADALHDRADPLKTHAGIHRGLGKRGQGTIGRAVELHENIIPDLHVAVTVATHGTVRAITAHLRSLIVEYLRAGTAGTGIPHGPEVVFLTKTEDALPRNTLLKVPDIGRLVVVGIDRHIKASFIQAYVLRQELPGIGNGLFLEIVAKREIAEHLEKGVMARRPAHVFKVVVLAPGPYALLRTAGPGVVPLFQPEEAILELVHAGIGKHERGIILGDDARAGHHRMSPVSKKR